MAAKLLIVDDDPSVLKAQKRLLSSKYEVISASSSREALEVVNREPGVDLVISDVFMPEMFGTELLREITRVSPAIFGILITGSVDNLTDVAPNLTLLRKPFSADKLFQTIEALVDKRRTDRT